MRFMGLEGGREGRTLFKVLFTGYLHGAAVGQPARLIVFYAMQKVKSLIC